ncbi:tetratricopeptide repeat protein [Azospirillum sp. B510]|uniref:O-linked N-acetylglucosamine transferase family protein n=1 Tax=Azospirillum sp. (strain B510) TaxID=137722 RepID=UPI0013052CCB|nr:tetratricopeptide repeat protein [Azospirillum sp. B510]
MTQLPPPHAVHQPLPVPAPTAIDLFNKGVALLQNGQREKARALFRSLAALVPDFGWSHLALGQMALDEGMTDKAVTSLAVALRTGCGDAVIRLVTVTTRLCQEGRPGEAERAVRALDVAAIPETATGPLASALADMGALWHLRGQLHRAMCWMRRALALSPGDTRIWGNLAASLKVQGLLDDAERACRHSLALDPLNDSTHVNLLQTLEHQPDLSETALFEAHAAWGRLYQAQAAGRLPPPGISRIPGRRLRIGYVALNFAGGPRRLFLTHLLEHRDREAFETICYSADPAEASPPPPLRDAAEQWRTTAGLSDEALVALIRADEIDILVDLDGHSNGNRLRAFALKPAPVQVSWIGYFHTTGLPAMDAIFMDAAMVRPGEEGRFVERVIRLPYSRFCYKAPDCAGAVAPPPSVRRGAVTFGSFNLIAKLNPRVIRVWSRVLQAVPASRLLLKSINLSDPVVCHRLEEAFAVHGIGRDRLELRGPSSHAAMFEEYGDVDIALDPFPFTGGITSCEALWMGLPIVTMPGERPVSRQTAGLLDILGLNGLIARDEDEYVRIAAALASDSERLLALRTGLRPRMAASPLCDSAGMIGRVEATYRMLWQDRCARSEARASALRLAAMAPDQACMALLERTRTHLQNGQSTAALSCGRAALACAPQHLAAMINQGTLLMQGQRPVEAALWLRRVVALDPAVWQAQAALLRVLAEAGQHSAAVEAAHAAMRRCPELLLWDRDALVAVFNAAVALYRRGDARTALAALEMVGQAAPDLAQLKKALCACHHMLGQQAIQAGDLGTGRHHYGAALQIDPAIAELHAAMAGLEVKERPYAAARHSLRAWELEPGNAVIYSGAWQLMNKIGSDFSSLEELSADLARQWSYAAQIGVGNALRQAGRADEAQAAYRMAACLCPSYPFTYTRLGCLYAVTGRHEEADRCFERVGHIGSPTREEAIRLSPAFLERLDGAGVSHPGTVEMRDTPIPDGIDHILFSSGDAAYITKFAFSLVNSINQNHPHPAVLHIHAINPDARSDAEIARIKNGFPRIQIVYSFEKTDIEPFGDEKKTYFACARFLILPCLLQMYDKPILMLDMDLLLLRDPSPLRDMVGKADFAAVGGSMMEIWNEMWADVVYIQPGRRSVDFFDFAARYMLHFLVTGRSRWFLDQIALFVARHRQQPDEKRAEIHILPSSIHKMEMVVLSDGSIRGGDDAFFWSVHASLPTSAQQITSPQFQSYCKSTPLGEPS